MTTDLRPGIASRRLPGAVNELLASGDLPAETPALAAFERALPPEWFAFEAVGYHLDQKGWPLRNEVELALRVCAHDPALTASDRSRLSEVRRWLDGELSEDGLHAEWRISIALKHGSFFADVAVPDEECLRFFAMLCPDATDADRALFLDARRHPVPDTAAALVVACAHEARTGWLAYHVHRGLASPSALHAADVLRGVVRSGRMTWSEVVDVARSIGARDPDASPR